MPYVALGMSGSVYRLLRAWGSTNSGWVTTVPPTFSLTADSFGPERVGIVFGWFYASHQLGAAFAAWVAGASRGWFGSYTFAFVSSGALCLLAAALSLRIGVHERRPRPVAEPLPA